MRCKITMGLHAVTNVCIRETVPSSSLLQIGSEKMSKVIEQSKRQKNIYFNNSKYSTVAGKQYLQTICFLNSLTFGCCLCHQILISHHGFQLISAWCCLFQIFYSGHRTQCEQHAEENMIKKADGLRNADMELKDISEGCAALPSAMSDGSVCLGLSLEPCGSRDTLL